MNQFMALIKGWLSPKPLSKRWFRVSSKSEIEAVRQNLWNILMDPNANEEYRVRIRDYLLPLIDRYLREK